MSGFTATIDATQFIRKITAMDKKVRANVVKELNRVATKTASDLRAAAPRDTSNLAVHIHPTKASESTLSVEIRSDAKYTCAVDKGSKLHFPPPDALVGWAMRHPYGGYSPEASAFLIARAISVRGTKARNFIDGPVRKGEQELKTKLKDATINTWGA